ncbi:MAG: hypothetical protein IPI10_18705 [Bacteroidetes bacterium]|nr:hypothetical protein [Bacteroidota bacterium]
MITRSIIFSSHYNKFSWVPFIAGLLSLSENDPCIIWNHTMFSPSLDRESSNLFIGSLPLTTMTSADFFACPARGHEDLLGKSNSPKVFTPAATSLNFLYNLDFGWLCYLIRSTMPPIQFLFVSANTPGPAYLCIPHDTTLRTY